VRRGERRMDSREEINLAGSLVHLLWGRVKERKDNDLSLPLEISAVRMFSEPHMGVIFVVAWYTHTHTHTHTRMQ
jgi:hypothetical protein